MARATTSRSTPTPRPAAVTRAATGAAKTVAKTAAKTVAKTAAKTVAKTAAKTAATTAAKTAAKTAAQSARTAEGAKRLPRRARPVTGEQLAFDMDAPVVAPTPQPSASASPVAALGSVPVPVVVSPPVPVAPAASSASTPVTVPVRPPAPAVASPSRSLPAAPGAARDTRAARPTPARPVAGPAGPLTPAQRQEIEHMLVGERTRMLRTRRSLEDTLGPGEHGRERGGDVADASGEIATRENATMVADHTLRALAEVEDALTRLRTTPERFGVCDVSGEYIPFGRLLVMPTARTLVQHGRR